MTQLLGRKLSVFIGAYSENEERVYTEDFNIDFTVKKTIDGKTPDTLTCSLYNVDRQNIWNYLFLDDAYIRLEGGYKELYGTLFQGDITNATQYTEGVNLITEIDAGDGDQAINEVDINKAFAPEINIKSVLDDILNAITKNSNIIVDGFAKGEIAGIPGKLDFGDILNGKAINYMHDYLKAANKSFAVVNNVLKIFEDSYQDQIIKLTSESGLVGSPREKRVEKTSKAKGKEITQGIDFKCLLMPGLNPGQRININDNEYTIQEISYTGNSRTGSYEASGFAI